MTGVGVGAGDADCRTVEQGIEQQREPRSASSASNIPLAFWATARSIASYLISGARSAPQLDVI